MSLFGSSGAGPVADTKNQKLLANITREMYEDYKKRYLPLEKELVAEVLDEKTIDQKVKEGMGITDRAYNTSRGTFYRNAERAGLSMTSERVDDYEDRFQRNKTAGLVDTFNQTTAKVDDRNIALRQDLISSGRGLAATATANLNTVANLEATRNATNRSLAAQDSASGFNALGTAIGIGLSFI